MYIQADAEQATRFAGVFWVMTRTFSMNVISTLKGVSE